MQENTPLSFTLALAGRSIRATVNYPTTQRFCEGYLLSGEAASKTDFAVIILPEDLAFERERAEHADPNARGYSDSYLETLALYRKIVERLPEYDTILFHGSAIAVDGNTYLFTAPSGTGKSTHTRLWREAFGSRAVMINDDKPLIRVGPDELRIYGTPWMGKHRLGNNISMPLTSICLLERAEENTIRPITKKEAYVPLLRQTYRPFCTASMQRTMELFDRLLDTAELYRLGCNMEPEAATVSYNGMNHMMGGNL